MNKDEYLTRLKDKLDNIPLEEAQNIVQYYCEYFDEAGVENEQKVIKELGSPESLAKRVTADYIIRDYKDESSHNSNKDVNQNTNTNTDANTDSYEKPNDNLNENRSFEKNANESNTEFQKKKKRGGLSDVGIILAAVFSSPIWFPLGIVAAALVFTLFVVMAALVFALSVSCIAVAGSSVLVIIFGIIALFIHFPSGVACIGVGLVCIGTGILFAILTRAVIGKVKDLFMFISGKIIRRGKK